MHPSWRAVYELLLRDATAFTPLDAAQLVKHYWGLKNTRTHPTDVLLYAYWEPVDAAYYAAFQRHRRAIEDFSSRVDDPSCRFVTVSYPELWDTWSRDPALAAHLTRLRARYGVRVGS